MEGCYGSKGNVMNEDLWKRKGMIYGDSEKYKCERLHNTMEAH